MIINNFVQMLRIYRHTDGLISYDSVSLQNMESGLKHLRNIVKCNN